jgi:hypothetical protein
VSVLTRAGTAVVVLVAAGAFLSYESRTGKDEDGREPLVVHVEWASKKFQIPACEWSVNAPGVGKRCADMPTARSEEGGLIHAWWEATTKAKTGDTLFLSAQGVNTEYLDCQALWKNEHINLPSGPNRCDGTAVLP